MKTANNVLRLMAIVALTSSAVQAMQTGQASPTSVTASVVKPFNNNVTFWFMQNGKSPVTVKNYLSSSTRPSTIIDVLQNANNQCELLVDNDTKNANTISQILHEVRTLVNAIKDRQTLDNNELSSKIFAIFKTLESKIPADMMIKTNAISENLAEMKQRFITELGLTTQEAAEQKAPSFLSIFYKAASSANLSTDINTYGGFGDEDEATTGVPTYAQYYKEELAEQAKQEKEARKWSTSSKIALATATTAAAIIAADMYYNNGAHSTQYVKMAYDHLSGETARQAAAKAFEAETARLIELKESYVEPTWSSEVASRVTDSFMKNINYWNWSK